MRSVFLAAHPDDETLFGTFTLLRERPLVIVVLACGAGRAIEFASAMTTIGVDDIGVWGAYDEASPDWAAIRERIHALHADRLYVPAFHEDGNGQHNELCRAADGAAPTTHYLTYTHDGKQMSGQPVSYEPEWIGLKLRALACYGSQFQTPGRATHFLRDQSEFYAGGLDG